MKVIGLTGSIAMGKSEVAKVFAAHGIPVFDADAEVHAFYASAEGANLLRPIVPAAVAAGMVDRGKLSAAILADQALLSRIESTVHAEISRRRALFLKRAKAAGHGVAVVDIPLLFETGSDREVDVTIAVSAPAAEQRARAMARPGMTAEKLEMILKRQMPDQEKRKRASIVIENNGTLEDLRSKAEAVISALREKNP